MHFHFGLSGKPLPIPRNDSRLTKQGGFCTMPCSGHSSSITSNFHHRSAAQRDLIVCIVVEVCRANVPIEFTAIESDDLQADP